MFQTATSGKFAKPHCKTTPPGFWCNSLNLFSKESQRESRFFKGAQDEDQGVGILKASGSKVYWQFFSAQKKMGFCGWLQYYFRFRSCAYRKDISFPRDFNSCPIKWLLTSWWFLFRQGKSSNLPKGMNSFWGIWFLVNDLEELYRIHHGNPCFLHFYGSFHSYL